MLLVMIMTFGASLSTNGSIGIAWTPPALNRNGHAITQPLTYDVWRSHNGAGYELTPHQGVSVTALQITGNNLTPGVRECFKITAHIAGGQASQFSKETCVVPT